MLMGLGALVEINEFIGTAYFGMENGGIFAIGDYFCNQERFTEI